MLTEQRLDLINAVEWLIIETLEILNRFLRSPENPLQITLLAFRRLVVILHSLFLDNDSNLKTLKTFLDFLIIFFYF